MLNPTRRPAPTDGNRSNPGSPISSRAHRDGPSFKKSPLNTLKKVDLELMNRTSRAELIGTQTFDFVDERKPEAMRHTVQPDFPTRYHMPKNLKEIAKMSGSNRKVQTKTVNTREGSVNSLHRNKSTDHGLHGECRQDLIEKANGHLKTVYSLISPKNQSDRAQQEHSPRNSPGRSPVDQHFHEHHGVRMMPFNGPMGYYPPMVPPFMGFNPQFIVPPQAYSRESQFRPPYMHFMNSNMAPSHHRQSFHQQVQPESDRSQEEEQLWETQRVPFYRHSELSRPSSHLISKSTTQEPAFAADSEEIGPSTLEHSVAHRLANKSELRQNPSTQKSVSMLQPSTTSNSFKGKELTKVGPGLKSSTNIRQNPDLHAVKQPITSNVRQVFDHSMAHMFKKSNKAHTSVEESPFASIFGKKDKSLEDPVSQNRHPELAQRPSQTCSPWFQAQVENILEKHHSTKDLKPARKSEPVQGQPPSIGDATPARKKVKEATHKRLGAKFPSPVTSNSNLHDGEPNVSNSQQDNSFFTKNHPVMIDACNVTDLTSRKIDDSESQSLMLMESIGSEVRKVSDLNRVIRDYQHKISELEFELRKLKSIQADGSADGAIYGMNIYDPVDKLTELMPPNLGIPDCSESYDFASISSGNYTEKGRFSQPTIMVSNSNVQIMTNAPEKANQRISTTGERRSPPQAPSKKVGAPASDKSAHKQSTPPEADWLASTLKLFDDPEALDEDLQDLCVSQSVDPVLTEFLLAKRKMIRELKETVVMAQHERDLKR